MAITRINNNQITDSVAGNLFLGVNAAVKIQDFSVTAGKIANNLTYDSDLTVTGNLTVQGNTTAIDTINLVVEDPLILLAKEQTGAPALDIGFIGKRGTEDNIAFVWDESADQFVAVFTTSEVTNSTININSYASLQVLDLTAANANITGNLTFNGSVIGNVDVTGNITGGNLISDAAVDAVTITASGNLVGGNANIAGDVNSATVTASGNVSGGNLVTLGNVDAANVNASAGITAGTSVTATGNVSGGNLITLGNVDGANVNASAGITAGTTIVATGNVSGGNITTAGNVDAANVNASAGITAGTTVVATGNVSGGNITTAGNVDAANVNATANVTGAGAVFSGNVTADTFIGNISGNIDAGGANTNIQFNDDDILNGSAAFTFDKTSNLVTATGNISGGNIITAGNVDGANVNATAGITAGTTVTAIGNVSGGNITTAGNVDGANVNATTAVTAVTVTASGNVNGGNINSNSIVGTDIVITASSVDMNLTGNLSMSGRFINDLGTPSIATDAATKQYVDDAVSAGIHIHPPVDVETPTALPAATYANGGNTFTVNETIAGNTVVFTTAANLQVNDQLWFDNSFNGVVGNLAYFVVSTPNTSAAVLSTQYNGVPVSNITSGSGLTESVRVNSGIGATLTATANGALTVDGYAVSAGNRILVDDQVNQIQNGVYVVTDAGNVTAPFILTRSSDADTYEPQTSTGLDDGSYFYVQFGDTGAGASYVKTAPTGPFIFGVANIEFTQFSASQVYSANTQAGLVLNGTVFSAKVDNDTTAFDGGGNIAVKASANLVTPNIGNATGNSLTLGGNGLLSAATVTATGNVSGGNLVTLGNVDAANVNATAGITAGTTIVATGNVSGGNLVTLGNVDAANVNATAGITAGTTIVATGNVSGGNITTVGNVDGANVNATAGITAGTTIVATGNVSGGNLVTTGNIDGANVNASAGITAGTTIVATGNVSGGNLVTLGNVDAANVNASAGITAGTTIVATGNVSGGNLVTTGNIDGANINATANVTGAGAVFSGNVTADTFIGNIQGNIDAGGANTNIQFNDDDVLAGSAAFTFDKTSNAVTATGNITGGNLITTGTADLGNIRITGNDITNFVSNIITINAAASDIDVRISGDTVANLLLTDAGTDTVVIGGGNATTGAALKVDTTDSMMVPVGNTIQRPGSPEIGMFRFNTGGDALEVYTSGGWEDVGVPAFTVIIADAFVGDGSTVAFTLSANSTTAGTIVSINGIVQEPTTAYSVSSTTLTFTEAPAVSDNIDARILTTTTTVTNIENASGNAVIETLDSADTVQITGNILPLTSNTYNLGSTSLRWNELFLQGSTITLGNTVIKNTTGNSIGFFGPDGSTPATIDAASVDTTQIASGTSSMAVIASGGNIRANVDGNTVGVFSGSGLIVTGSIEATNGFIGLDATSIANGTANVRTFEDANVTVSAGGNGNVMIVTATGANVTGTITATGNITGGNLVTTGNVQAGNLIVSGIEAVTTLNVSGDTLINGNLTVSGNTITANVATIVITDPILGLGRGANGDPLTTNDGLDRGIEMFYYNTAERIAFMGFDNNTSKMLSAANVSIANNIVTVNSFGTTVVGTLETAGIVNTNANGVGNIGSSTTFFNTVFAKATSAQYADLAEMYEADAAYEPGTVLCFGGAKEVTVCGQADSTRVAGVVSTNPSYLMNSGQTGEYVAAVALTGRVPCRVTGTIRKGDLIVAAGDGRARANNLAAVGTVIGKALADFDGADGVIEVVVGRV